MYAAPYLQREEERARRLRRPSAPPVRLRNKIIKIHIEPQLVYTVLYTVHLVDGFWDQDLH